MESSGFSSSGSPDSVRVFSLRQRSIDLRSRHIPTEDHDQIFREAFQELSTAVSSPISEELIAILSQCASLSPVAIAGAFADLIDRARPSIPLLRAAIHILFVTFQSNVKIALPDRIPLFLTDVLNELIREFDARGPSSSLFAPFGHSLDSESFTLLLEQCLLIAPSPPIDARFLPFLMATNSGLNMRDFVADAITRDYVSELPTDVFTRQVLISDLPTPLFQRLVPVMPEQSFRLQSIGVLRSRGSPASLRDQ
jgi:hypothetical protein